VIPQFSDASEEAKLSSLVSDLRTVRSQIQLYKYHHSGNLPGTVGGVSFEDSMTKYTIADGTLATTQALDPNVYGPYLQKMPTNPFDDSVDITAGAGSPPGDDSSGWYYNAQTGAFNANDSAEHAGL
jgi:hypothetical protein